MSSQVAFGSWWCVVGGEVVLGGWCSRWAGAGAGGCGDSGSSTVLV